MHARGSKTMMWSSTMSGEWEVSYQFPWTGARRSPPPASKIFRDNSQRLENKICAGSRSTDHAKNARRQSRSCQSGLTMTRNQRVINSQQANISVFVFPKKFRSLINLKSASAHFRFPVTLSDLRNCWEKHKASVFNTHSIMADRKATLLKQLNLHENVH